MLEAIKDWWHVIAGLGALMGMVGASVYKGHKQRRKEISILKFRLGRLENEHEAHKDSCALRWQQLRESNQRRDEHIDERHRENQARFDRQDQMLVELLKRNDLRRGPRNGD